jgi:membrane protease YdiL (CAAX protease family)
MDDTHISPAGTPVEGTAEMTPLPSAPILAPPRESPLREVFVGPHGLRAGTRLLIYLAMVAAILLVLGTGIHFLQPYTRGRVWAGMLSEGSTMLAALIPGFVMARFEGRSFGEYGLPGRTAFGRLFWVGAVWGLVWLTVLMLVLRACGAFYFGSLALHGLRLLKFAAYYAVFFLVVAFFEEFFVRGYPQFILSKGIDFWPAAAVLSVSFGALHGANPGEAKTGLVAAGLIGFFFCLTLRRTGNLWFAVGFHASWDWGETYLYSVPNSGTTAPGHLLNSSFHGPVWLTGGSVGPEGSALIFVLLVALWVAFDRIYPDVRFHG